MVKKLLKILMFIMIIFLSPNVLADDFIATNTITAPSCSGSNCSGGHYSALEIYNSGSQNVYATSTRYNGQLSTIKFNLPLPSNWPDGQCFSSGDLNYTITLNMATEDWRNHFARPFVSSSSSGTNWSTSSVVFVSYKKIYFNFKIPATSNCYDFLYVYLQSPNQSSTAFTGVSNWNLSSVVLTANFPNGGSNGSGSGSSGGSSATNQDIINSSNQNTNSIIENSNDNTNSIIENNNENTDRIVNQQEITNQCSKTNILDSSMCYNTSGSNDIECRVPVNSGVNYSFNVGSYNWSRARLYDKNGSYLTTFGSGSTDLRSFNFTSVANSSYALLTFYPGNNVSVSNVDFSNVIFKCLTKDDEISNSIIENSNNNTQDLINSNKSCTRYDKSSVEITGQALNYTNGSLFSASGYGITPYLKIDSNTTIKIYEIESSNTSGICFYNVNKTLISCLKINTLSNGDTLTIPANSDYIRSTIRTFTNKPQLEICKNGNQAITDSLTDDNVSSGTGSDFFNNFEDEDFGLSDIITIPLTTIQGLTSKTCTALSIPIPFTNSSISLPCMTEIYQTKFPTIFSLWQIVSFGIIGYFISIDIFYLVKGFKDPESDKVEVLDL